MFAELFAAVERWDRQLTDDLSGNAAAPDAAVTVIVNLRPPRDHQDGAFLILHARRTLLFSNDFRVPTNINECRQ